MNQIRKTLNTLDRITRGRTHLMSEELLDVLGGLGIIHIEAHKKENGGRRMNKEWLEKYISMSLKTIEKEIKFIRKYLKQLMEIEE